MALPFTGQTPTGNQAGCLAGGELLAGDIS